MDSSTKNNLHSPLKAIALAYDDPDKLPRVLASGNDELARLIIEIAKSAEIPIQENKELISLLEKQKSGPIVSARALKVLAEVIAFLYHTDNVWKKGNLNSAAALP